LPGEAGADDPDRIRVRIAVTDEAKRALPTLRHYMNGVEWPSGPIAVSNPEAAVAIAFDRRLSADFLAKRVQSLEVSGDFTISNYIVGGDCDHKWASATLVKARIEHAPIVDGKRKESGC
jgi:hypothetical protein